MGIFFDSDLSDLQRREQLYNGQLFVFSPSASTRALIDFAQEYIQEAFGAKDPRRAQYSMSVEEFVAVCAPLKPRFIHDPRTMRLLIAVVEELACDLTQTYIDVPRLRIVTHGGYLTSGIGYAHHPHRDTWYSAPMCQLNWWLPIYPFNSESGMAFHSRYWDQPVKNGSSSFNYYQWNAEDRKKAAQYITSDTRVQPRAEEPLELTPQTTLVCPPGGIVMFSAAQLHSTVPNTSGLTRYSIDFRTVDLGDVCNMRGAQNVDSAPSGTSLRDFRRAVDLARIPEEVVRRYDEHSLQMDTLIFEPAPQGEV
jgi:hypothetical protein